MNFPAGFPALDPSQTFSLLLDPLDEDDFTLEKFNLASGFHAGGKGLVIPPLSTSPIGQYILVLFKAYPAGAAAVWMQVLVRNFEKVTYKPGQQVRTDYGFTHIPTYNSFEVTGFALLNNFTVLQTLGVGDLSQTSLKALSTQAKNQIDAISDERDGIITQKEKQQDHFDQLQKDRNLEFDLLKANIQNREAENQNLRNKEIAKQNEEADQFIAKLKEQLPFHAAVDFWKVRATEHMGSEVSALKWYRIYLGAFTGALVAVLFSSGWVFNFVYSSMCTEGSALECSTLFSPPKILIVTVFLLLITIGLWVIRLQQKMFLSERHLRLDAQERAAFVQTYLAMRTEDQIGIENQNIMIASLMRPTQDGIIKDDEGQLDPSIAAMLSKFLGKSS